MNFGAFAYQEAFFARMYLNECDLMKSVVSQRVLYSQRLVAAAKAIIIITALFFAFDVNCLNSTRQCL